jgi:hypothetical protein
MKLNPPKNIAEKQTHAKVLEHKLQELSEEHPKAWDKYIAERQKRQQDLAGGKRHANK